MYQWYHWKEECLLFHFIIVNNPFHNYPRFVLQAKSAIFTAKCPAWAHSTWGFLVYMSLYPQTTNGGSLFLSALLLSGLLLTRVTSHYGNYQGKSLPLYRRTACVLQRWNIMLFFMMDHQRLTVKEVIRELFMDRDSWGGAWQGLSRKTVQNSLFKYDTEKQHKSTQLFSTSGKRAQPLL